LFLDLLLNLLPALRLDLLGLDLGFDVRRDLRRNLGLDLMGLDQLLDLRLNRLLVVHRRLGSLQVLDVDHGLRQRWRS
jgi:hypothetical protein